MENTIILVLIGVIALVLEVLWFRERDKRMASERECEKLRAELDESKRETAWWRKSTFESLELAAKAIATITEGVKDYGTDY